MGLSLAAADGGWRPKYHSSVYFFTYYKQEFFMTKYDILTLLHKINTVELILNQIQQVVIS